MVAPPSVVGAAVAADGKYPDSVVPPPIPLEPSTKSLPEGLYYLTDHPLDEQEPVVPLQQQTLTAAATAHDAMAANLSRAIVMVLCL